MQSYYAVIPDGGESPAALFAHIEQALDWGIAQFGQDAFVVRGFMGLLRHGTEQVAIAKTVVKPAVPVRTEVSTSTAN
jgi:hypothetical protein